MQKNIFIIIMICLSFIMTPAFAQSEILSVNIANSAYEKGDSIIISGKVTPIVGIPDILLQIFFEDNAVTNLIEIGQISVAQDGSYTHTVNSQGPTWKKNGEYIIRASYGANTAETSFDFLVEKKISQISDNFQVDAGDSGTFDVEYIINGGMINNMMIHPYALTLIISIDAVNDGSLTLDLPRDSIDAKENGCKGSDEFFIILIDGIYTPYEKIADHSDKRTIKIEFMKGSSSIEIIGTCIIPEFGTVAMLVFAVAVVLAIFFLKNIFGFPTGLIHGIIKN